MLQRGVNNMRGYLNVLSLFIVFMAIGVGCSSDHRSKPKPVVQNLFKAIHESDSTFLSTHVDLTKAARSIGHEFAFIVPDSASDDTLWASALLGALTGEGFLRERWLADQIVLGKAFVQGDTAYVEVSFLDRVTRVQYYNKMRLVYREELWVITDFRTM